MKKMIQYGIFGQAPPGVLLYSLHCVQSALRKPPTKQQPFGYVTYEIHLHPTYGAPCLWFRLNGLGPDEPAFDIDTVFRRLVPDQYKDALRSNGPIGGISVDVGSFCVCSCCHYKVN